MFIPKHSKWIAPSGRILEVAGIWGRGAGCNYVTVGYDLQETDGKINYVRREVLINLIDNKKLTSYND